MRDNLKNNEFSYPPDDGLPTANQLAAIARMVPQDIELTCISSLIDEHKANQAEPDKENALEQLMSGITEENTHERMSFGPIVGRELL